MNKDILKKIAKGLNKLDCTWAIGGSVMLNHFGLVEKPNDIDILIDASHSDKVKEFMNSIGTYNYHQNHLLRRRNSLDI